MRDIAGDLGVERGTLRHWLEVSGTGKKTAADGTIARSPLEPKQLTASSPSVLPSGAEETTEQRVARLEARVAELEAETTKLATERELSDRRPSRFPSPPPVRTPTGLGDMAEIPTAADKLHLATVIDLYSRRLLGAATGLHPNAELACLAIEMAVAARGGLDAVDGPSWREDESQQVIFHTDRAPTYTANSCTELCRQLGSGIDGTGQFVL